MYTGNGTKSYRILLMLNKVGLIFTKTIRYFLLHVRLILIKQIFRSIEYWYRYGILNLTRRPPQMPIKVLQTETKKSVIFRAI